MDFNSWIQKKYDEWRAEKYGQDGSITAFAETVLGVSDSLARDWIKRGKKPKSKKAIDALIARYGDEAYTALGLPVPSKDDYIDLEGRSTEEVIKIIQRLAEQHGLEVVIHRDEKSQKGKS